jgi:hypothetical protein
MKTGIHRASSQSWGDSACARLCGIIVDSNTGIAQQVIENRTDLLDIYSKEELVQPDEFGLTIQFLAVYHDQPDILVYLKKRGVDLSLPCDPMKFANPMFYAIRLEKHRLIRVLDLLGCSVNQPCDDLKNTPTYLAQRLNDEVAQREIKMAQSKELRAAILFRKHFLRSKFRKRYLKTILMIILIQKTFRGLRGRRLGQERLERVLYERSLLPEWDDEPTKKSKKKKKRVD